MSKKRRIYQVAKEFNLSIDVLTNFLAKANFDVHSHMSPVTDEMYEEVSKKFSKITKIVGVDSDIRQKLKEKKSVEDEKKRKELLEYEEMLKVSSMVMTEMPRRRKRMPKKDIYSEKTQDEIDQEENVETDSINKEEQEEVLTILETGTGEEVSSSLEINQPVEDIIKIEPNVVQNGLKHENENGKSEDGIKIYDENILYSIIETRDQEGLETFFPNIVEHELENAQQYFKSSVNVKDMLNYIITCYNNNEFDKVEKAAPALYHYEIQNLNENEKKCRNQAAIYYGVSRSSQMNKNNKKLCAAQYLMDTYELFLRYKQHTFDLTQPVDFMKTTFYNILNSGQRIYNEDKLKDYKNCIIDALNSNDEALKQNLIFGRKNEHKRNN